MAPTQPHHLLSPAELSYLSDSLALTPPIRPDGRSPTQFRPLVAESDILPAANGSARVCFADGGEAVVGVKCEVERTARRGGGVSGGLGAGGEGYGEDGNAEEDREGQGGSGKAGRGKGEDEWVEMSIEIPGYRDDDALPVFLAAMLVEALLADGRLTGELWINRRFHWKLYIDVRIPHYPQPSTNLVVIRPSHLQRTSC